VLEKNAENSMDRKVKNVEVFRRMNAQKSIWITLRLKRKSWVEHVIRNSL